MNVSGAKDTKALQFGATFTTVSKGTNAGVCMSEKEKTTITVYCCRSSSSVSLRLLGSVEGILVVIVFIFANSFSFLPLCTKTTSRVGSISKGRGFLSQFLSPELAPQEQRWQLCVPVSQLFLGNEMSCVGCVLSGNRCFTGKNANKRTGVCVPSFL